MKKKIVVVSMICALTLSMTGCSFSDLKAKFTGNSSEESYVAAECITMGDYNGVEVDCSVSDDEVESEITTLQNEKATTKKIKNRAAKSGDATNIDFVGKVDGKEFDGGSSEGYSLTLGSNSFITGFEDGVVGMKAGEKKDLKLKFPDDYQTENLRGKDVVFTVTLNYIEESVTPKVTDSFVAKNSDYKTVDEFRSGKKKELIEQNKTNAGATALTNFADTVKVTKYPESLVTRYKDELDKQFKATLKSYSMEFSDYLSKSGMTEDDYKKQLDEVSKEQTKTHLVCEAIADKEKLSVTDDEVTKQIETMVSTYQAKDAAALREQFKTNYGVDLDQYVKTMKLQEKVETFMKKSVKIKE